LPVDKKIAILRALKNGKYPRHIRSEIMRVYIKEVGKAINSPNIAEALAKE
jgi:hypothetical protein